MTETKTSCPLCWFDIPADDMERATRFYEEVFGFGIEAMKDMPYTTLDGTANMKPTHSTMAGIRPRMEMEKGPLLYFNVPSLDQWHGKVEKAGGKILQAKMPVGDFGLMTICLDTEGNSIAIWQDLKA